MRATAVVTIVAVVAGLVTAPVANAATPRAQAPQAATGTAVPARPVAVHKVAVPTMTAAPSPTDVWPTAAQTAVSVAGSASASVAPQGTARALGLRGVVLSLGGNGSTHAHVSVSYAGFAKAYGGDYASRLHLVQLPVCALSTPTLTQCRTSTPVGSHNDASHATVTADVTVPASGRTALALVAGPSGSGGDYAAEPLSEAANDWVSGPSSGAYTYSYPIDVPPVPGGLKPTVSLGYDSLATSGLDSATNDEASWIGDGWDYLPGFVEQDYATCSSSAAQPQTGDLCGGRTQVTLSLNGLTTPLVDGANGWRAESDSGAQVVQSGSTWKVITPDGTTYYFGLDQLPGYATGDPITHSQWTVPVWQGCGQPSFCDQPWRDMLSYVVDPHGDAIAYNYATETNAYAEQNGTTANATYTRGGSLSSISYGFRAGQYYSGNAAAQVNFTTVASRPDAPTDLACTNGSPCAQTSPTFWSNTQLTGIGTQALSGGALRNVDSWALNGTYPDTGDPSTSPSLWLSSITRTGQDGADPITLPPVSFLGTPLPNRVMTPADTAAGYSAITRFYLTDVTNESGGVTSVAYSAPASAGTPPAPNANSTATYPDYWLQPGVTTPVLDWFNAYAADTITRKDQTGGDPDIVTSHTYAKPAWHYDGDTVSRSATVTWDQFRGYQSVTTETGTAPDPVTETVDTYLQGLSQNGPQNNPGPVVTVTTSRGQNVTDSDQFAGKPLESITYDGAGTGQEVTDTVSAPWTSPPTAVNTALDQSAFLTGTTSTQTYTALAGGGVRQSVRSYLYTADGLLSSVSDVPDTNDSSQSTCTSTTYAADAASGLIDLPSTVVTATGVCTAGGGPNGSLVTETEYLYDGGALGAAPSAGNATKVEKAVSGGLVPIFTSTSATYDQYGRALTSTDGDGRTTTTAYTPATGGEPTTVQVTDPVGLTTSTTYDVVRDLSRTVTDPSGGQKVTAYDALGRPTAQWTAGNPVAGPPVKTFAYTVSNTGPTVTITATEEPGGGYLNLATIEDAFGQAREIQQQTAGGGSDVTETDYNSDGWKSSTTAPYFISAAPSSTLVTAADANLPSRTGLVYDGAGRPTRQISYTFGNATWETDTSYGGNFTTVVPPAGGTSQTTFTDGRGLKTAIYQYHAGVPANPSDPPADYDQTTYTNTAADKLATITDAAGNHWAYTYDLLGNSLTQTDPDTGKTTSTYDAAGLLSSTTDARGKTNSYKYDADGRKIAEYDTTGGAAPSATDEVASWTYDTLAPGKPTSSTSFQGGAQYTKQVTGYNANGLPTGTAVVIPAAQGALAGTYTQQFTYAPTGQIASTTYQSAGGLPGETVTTGYDTAGEPDSLAGASTYVGNLSYNDLSQPSQYQLGGGQPVYLTDTYDPETSRLTEQQTQLGSSNAPVDDLNYTYNAIGEVLSQADTPAGVSGATDVECFQYDYLARLVQAWAQGTTGCAGTPSASAESGAAPYWESYSYNTIGNLTGRTATTPAGQATTTAETYPATGAAQPHAVTGESVTGSGTATYGYDASGDLTTLGSASQSQTLAYTDQGHLGQITTSTPSGPTQNTGYLYDASGTLLLRTDTASHSDTLILGDEELVLDTTTGLLTGTRYYSIGGMVVAARTGSSALCYLVGDQQGTASLAIDATTLGVTRRYYDPYGNPIATGSAAWPAGQKGFVGGTADASTGLTNLGAREYQPQTGSFITPDPLLNPYDPQHLNAYTYAADNPTTESDPSGQAALNAYGCSGSTMYCAGQTEAQEELAQEQSGGDGCPVIQPKCPPCPVWKKCPSNPPPPPVAFTSPSFSLSYETALGKLTISGQVTVLKPGDHLVSITVGANGSCTVKIKTPSGHIETIQLPTQDLMKTSGSPAAAIQKDLLKGVSTTGLPCNYFACHSSYQYGQLTVSTSVGPSDGGMLASATVSGRIDVGSGKNEVILNFAVTVSFLVQAHPGPITAPPQWERAVQAAENAAPAAIGAAGLAVLGWLAVDFAEAIAVAA